jgi:phosphoenolpyruvate synthase/pyruvate phosphate dikinase
LEEEVKTEKANSYRTPLVVTFAEAATLDHTELGAKSANLARLASVGFPVPPGFAVTTTAERH